MEPPPPPKAETALGRNLAHLVNTVQDLSARGVGLRVLAGQGAQIDTTTAAGRLVFGIFAALAEFERELVRERTVAGLKAARARGRKGGRKFALSKKLRCGWPSSPWWNPALHRERRGARLTRREEGAYWAYATDEQRSQAGCIAARMQRGLSPRAASVPSLK